MSLYILDTDHISLFLSGNRAIKNKIAYCVNDIAITIITVQEIFSGWINRINNPKSTSSLSYLYTRLWETTEFFKAINVLNFNVESENCYTALKRSSKNLAKKRIQKDLRIASIALTNNAIVVTRNYKDFSQVPNLRLENWFE